jgi:predicted RecA/RadA family phage recombinase
MVAQASYRHAGHAIEHTPSGALTGGDVVVLKSLVGVTPLDIAANALGALQIEGVHAFAKGADVFEVGDRVYFNDTTNLATLTAAGNVYAGVCTLAAATGDATVDVKLDPSAAGSSALLYAALAASTAVTTTTVETAFDSAYSIAANMLKVGDVIKVRAQAIATATNSTDTLNLKLYLGTVEIAATGAVDVANNDIGYIDAEVVIRTIGAGGTLVGAGVVALGVPGTVTAKPFLKASATVDTTAAASVAVKATWSTNNAGNSVRLDVMNVQLIRR